MGMNLIVERISHFSTVLRPPGAMARREGASDYATTIYQNGRRMSRDVSMTRIHRITTIGNKKLISELFLAPAILWLSKPDTFCALFQKHQKLSSFNFDVLIITKTQGF